MQDPTPDPDSARREALATELLERVAASATRVGMNASGWPGLEYLRADEPIRRTAACYEPALCLVAQGRKIAWLDEDQPVPYDPLHYLVVALPMPIDAEILDASPQKPFLAARVRLDRALMADVIAALDEGASEGVAPDDDPDPALATSPMDVALLDSVLRLMRAAQDERERRVLLEPLQREMLFRLALGPQGAMLRRLAFGSSSGNGVARAIRHVEEHFAEAPSVAQLARVAHMGESTFHRAFRRVTGTTPQRYLRRFRLHHARDLMLNEELTAAEASGRVGYPSPSQFSRDFKSLFGVTPKQSIDALRAGAPLSVRPS